MYIYQNKQCVIANLCVYSFNIHRNNVSPSPSITNSMLCRPLQKSRTPLDQLYSQVFISARKIIYKVTHPITYLLYDLCNFTYNCAFSVANWNWTPQAYNIKLYVVVKYILLNYNLATTFTSQINCCCVLWIQQPHARKSVKRNKYLNMGKWNIHVLLPRATPISC